VPVAACKDQENNMMDVGSTSSDSGVDASSDIGSSELDEKLTSDIKIEEEKATSSLEEMLIEDELPASTVASALIPMTR